MARMPPPRLHADQVDIDEALARSLVAAQHPQWAHLPIAPVPSGGTENVVFRLGDDLSLRMPMTPGAVDSLRKEVRWLPVLAPHLTLPVPEVVAEGEPGDGYPFAWAVVRWLDGADALSAPFDSLPRLAEELGGFVRELQSVDPCTVPQPGSEGFVRGLPLAGRDEHFRSWVVECEGLLDVDRVTAVWEDALAAPVWDGPPVWLHADLIPGNLLVRHGRLAGVLDFGAMATGDPAYDVTAAWHLLDRGSRPRFLELTGADEATVRRARGLVVSGGVIALPYYQHTNPAMVATARRGIQEVLDDVG
jgi:aminoglycoside phosphotransferase (APT) family kinase protein